MRASGYLSAGIGERAERAARAPLRAYKLALRCSVLLLLAAHAMPALADDDEIFEQNRTTYGDMGILEMPSARMAPDGQVSLTAADIDGTQWRITGGFQVLPWLEGTFRYSHIPHFFSDGSVLFDRSFGVKMRLFQETAYTPAVAVGVRDLIGTGIYGAEYVVLSKRFWTVDFTAGLGWGRLASTEMFPNPFGVVFQSFNTRSANTGQGGTIAFGQLFHGPDTSAFGGLNWQTPIDGLDFLVEYSSDRYLRERNNTHFFTRMPVNVGLSYRVLDNLSLSGGWFYGTTFGVTLSFHFDPKNDLFPQRLGPAPLPPAIRNSQEQKSALTTLIESRNELNFVGGSKLTPDTADVKTILAAAPSSALRDYEIDGRTLTLNIQGPEDMPAQCRIFAQVVAQSIPGIDSIAVADFSDHDGKVIMCPVQRRYNVASLNMVAAPQADPPPAANNSAPVGSAPGAFSFQPTVTDPREAEKKIREDAKLQNLQVDAVSVAATSVTLYFTNNKYYFESEAIGRISRVLLADTPPDVEVFRIVSVYRGVPMRETKILRSSLERVLNLYGSTAEIRDAVSLEPAPMDHPILDSQQLAEYPKYGWSIYPRLARSFFDPRAPVRVGLFADVSGYTELYPGITLETVLEGAIYNGLGTNAPSNSQLPHVRSDFGKYYEHGANGISSLDAVYRTRLAPDVFAEIKGGYLEDMFMGGGGQILWRPDGYRWAIGADVYKVWQRDFNRLFGVQSYNVVTGHLNIYYQSPWYGLDFAVHAGRYLAGDWGGTFEISRHFASGIEIGAFATFTNVPFSQFGEGSFDKGVILRIPLEWFLPINSQSVANLDFRPLTRDGGQRLLNDDSLYDETRRTSYGEIDEHINDIVLP